VDALEIEQATDQLLDLGGRPGAAHPGRKLLTLVHALAAGGDCIDDVELLRCGQTAVLTLGGQVPLLTFTTNTRVPQLIRVLGRG
jgi:hypothetical protein